MNPLIHAAVATPSATLVTRCLLAIAAVTLGAVCAGAQQTEVRRTPFMSNERQLTCPTTPECSVGLLTNIQSTFRTEIRYVHCRIETAGTGPNAQLTRLALTRQDGEHPDDPPQRLFLVPVNTPSESEFLTTFTVSAQTLAYANFKDSIGIEMAVNAGFIAHGSCTLAGETVFFQ
jgi:hypothetical protein